MTHGGGCVRRGMTHVMKHSVLPPLDVDSNLVQLCIFLSIPPHSSSYYFNLYYTPLNRLFVGRSATCSAVSSPPLQGKRTASLIPPLELHGRPSFVTRWCDYWTSTGATWSPPTPPHSTSGTPLAGTCLSPPSQTRKRPCRTRLSTPCTTTCASRNTRQPRYWKECTPWPQRTAGTKHLLLYSKE